MQQLRPLPADKNVDCRKSEITMLHLARSIATPERELIPFLFFQYCAVDDTASGYALTSFLAPMVLPAEDDALSAAVSSVGYALLFRMTNSPEKLIIARQKYGTAIRITCNILQSSVASETCWVIRVIIILALFEVGIPLALKTKLIYKSHSYPRTRRPWPQNLPTLKGLLPYSRLEEWIVGIAFLVAGG